ncbi:MAG TPA: glycosyl transferase family protein [Bryobacteraceae bacterium]|nr:glycosyl transferase family protein [Bryobacteraceae bacterium]
MISNLLSVAHLLIAQCLAGCDTWVARLLFPLALVILLSGLDDLALDCVALYGWLRLRFYNEMHDEAATVSPIRGSRESEHIEKRIAIFVPLWHEHAVISGMVEHNASAINYSNYHFFIGAYPNDDPTLDAVRDLEARFPHVHLAICPHNGPTSKADCLNWIYQRMLLFEEQLSGEESFRFDIVVTHDAEDLIHPEAFSYINVYASDYEMVQIPVLPLPTPVRDLVHGIYCDEFAEWQIKDMPARQIMGSFVPSNGVGTGFMRVALEKLANAEHNLIFEPGCLTEDYENGLRLHKLGCRQMFVPLTKHVTTHGASIVATREFFPRTTRTAIRQRSRWIQGICLQSWERHGWRGRWPEVYWFWRDRKGLFGNPLSLLSNFVFLYGAITWIAARCVGSAWGLAKYSLHPSLLAATLAIQIIQTTVRMSCTTRLYGFAFALAVPVRSVFANWINTIATWNAVRSYFRARIHHEPLVWVKTEHAYPSRSVLVEHKRKLGEILIGSAFVDEADVLRALETQPRGLRIGEHLVELGKITEEDLYEALSLQQSLPSGRLEPWVINANIARALPRRVVREWRVLPFRIASGNMFLASPEIPTDDLTRILRGFTRLSLRFHLVTPRNFDELADSLL